VIVHIFQESTRRYYNLDELWNAAPLLEIPEEEGLRGDSR